MVKCFLSPCDIFFAAVPQRTTDNNEIGQNGASIGHMTLT